MVLLIKETMNQKDIFRRLEFVEGVSSYNQITSDTGLEVAFCGTSNSGKFLYIYIYIF